MQITFKDIWNRLDELPEYPDFDTVGSLVDEYLSIPIAEHVAVKSSSLDLLWELSDKQWHTYESIDKTRKLHLENFLSLFENFSSTDEVEVIAGIISRFGLDGFYQKLKCKAQNNSLLYPNHIMEVILRILVEFGDDVKDPYSTLKQQIKN